MSSDSPTAKQVLGNLWQEARASIQKDFETKLAEQTERNAELQDETVHLEGMIINLEKELAASRQREQAGADTLRKTIADLDLARATQLTAESKARESENSKIEAESYAGDLKGALSAVAFALAELSAGGTAGLSSIEKEIQTYLSRLEGVAPGQETRAVFLQILEIDHSRREFDKQRMQLEAERSALLSEKNTLISELHGIQTALAVSKESRTGLERENTSLASGIKDREGRIQALERQIQVLQEEIRSLRNEHTKALGGFIEKQESLQHKLEEAVLKSGQLEIELAKAQKEPVGPPKV